MLRLSTSPTIAIHNSENPIGIGTSSELDVNYSISSYYVTYDMLQYVIFILYLYSSLNRTKRKVVLQILRNGYGSQSNDLSRGPPELVHTFVNRGSSHRRKSTACPKFDMFGYISRLSQ